MRPIEKSSKLNATGDPKEYKPWSKAKPELVKEIGSFCSYCEKHNSCSALHVEHIYGQKVKDSNGTYKYQHLKYQWNNFLLSCVNCNSVKGVKDIAILKPFLPHVDNLLHYIEVGIGGTISIKASVTGENFTRAKAFIELVGLDREPGHPNYSESDDRYDTRLKVYDIAERQWRKYTASPQTTDLETIVDVASTTGFFSIWYYLFRTHDEVIEALINGISRNGTHISPFPGTHYSSFDALDHFSTVPR